MTNRPSSSQLLQDYISIINTPQRKPLPPSTTPSTTPSASYNHPDIQYFQRVKAKNHFAYHKSKLHGKAIDKIPSKMTVFDPYSQEQLLARLRTYTAMNWHVPRDVEQEQEADGAGSGDTSEPLDELKCARNGWKCVSFSVTNHAKNHLLCTHCNQQLILKFETQPSTTIFALDEEAEKDDHEFNQVLKKKYLHQVVYEGHSSACSWRNFETPLQGIYYPRPHINITNELLIADYLKNLKNLIDNSMVLSEFVDQFDDTFVAPLDPTFVHISNHWLLQRYFRDNKENLSLLLEATPSWIYKLALYGWALNVQSFSTQVILLLICNKCNSRIFLNSDQPTKIPQQSNGINLSSSKVLTPCKYPVTADTDEFADEPKIDPTTEHKHWCCNVRDMTTEGPGIKIPAYFQEMLIGSKGNIGINGEYIQPEEDLIMDGENYNVKRRKSFDINEGLERLNKLRKLYLVDE